MNLGDKVQVRINGILNDGVISGINPHLILIKLGDNNTILSVAVTRTGDEPEVYVINTVEEDSEGRRRIND